MLRLLKVEPAAIGPAAAVLYAAAAMLYRAYVAKDMAVLDWDLLVAAGMILAGAWTRLKATPLARPRDAQKRPLVPGPRM